ncbi:uncharacterized protein EMH_0006560 [Eimeria mitis]|uniref:Uncharacterized protein n=1 Tax=Eimeria mitis TaxID=44415 RepID=U6K412_9EIME|nr:uncharacterized protein EMH_0006560 [Eimeria mitis]CDJ30493.1 hypothetical protein EMH_0006560 [Eimeria mitis]
MFNVGRRPMGQGQDDAYGGSEAKSRNSSARASVAAAPAVGYPRIPSSSPNASAAAGSAAATFAGSFPSVQPSGSEVNGVRESVFREGGEMTMTSSDPLLAERLRGLAVALSTPVLLPATFLLLPELHLLSLRLQLLSLQQLHWLLALR